MYTITNEFHKEKITCKYFPRYNLRKLQLKDLIYKPSF